jgi:hypothetical protein
MRVGDLRSIDPPVTIEQIRDLDARLLFVVVKRYYVPWRWFGKGRVRGMLERNGHDVLGWVSGMNSGLPKVDRAYVMVRPTWTCSSRSGDMYVYLRDIVKLYVLAERPEELLPGDHPALTELGAYLAHSEMLTPERRREIALHLEWCESCADRSGRIVGPHVDEFSQMWSEERGGPDARP